MTPPAYTDAHLRQRRFYLALPLVALPFLTLIYWKLVASNLDKHQPPDGRATGLQLNLPSADLSAEQDMDKLAYYRKADQDSANWAQQIKKDPYRQNQPAAILDSNKSVLMGLGTKAKQNSAWGAASQKASSQHAQLDQRLRALDKALTGASAPSFEGHYANRDPLTESNPQVTKLEQMMAGMQTDSLGADPEMAQLDGMLDKLLQLQQPEKSSLTPIAGSPDQRQYSQVSPARVDDQVTLLSARADSTDQALMPAAPAGFFGLDQDLQLEPTPGLTAVIERDQQLISGATVQLRLTTPLSVGANQIAENTLVYGIASLSGERLNINISSIRSGEQILSVDLSVYDLDGIQGIYIPGALSRTVAKQQLANQVQTYELDPGRLSVGAQAASAGIQMGKMMLAKKSRLTQVTLPEGYKVLLAQTNP